MSPDSHVQVYKADALTWSCVVNVVDIITVKADKSHKVQLTVIVAFMELWGLIDNGVHRFYTEKLIVAQISYKKTYGSIAIKEPTLSNDHMKQLCQLYCKNSEIQCEVYYRNTGRVSSYN